MSWRTWLGNDIKDFADFNLCEYADMTELCAAVKWHLPAKVYSPNRENMKMFLIIMEKYYSMTWDDFWTLGIGDNTGSWESYTNTPTKASIEIMQMFGKFIDAAGNL